MKEGTKFAKALQEERQRVRRFIYKPTEEMEAKQRAYLLLLEDRKKGITPLYTTADGKEYR